MDRVLWELEQIAFGDGPAFGREKALELLGKHVGLFKPKACLKKSDRWKLSVIRSKGALKTY